jgi:Tol biopolymer transport system component
MKTATLLIIAGVSVLTISCSSNSTANFIVFRNGPGELLRMNYNGTGRSVIFAGDDTNFNPTLSRNGKKIACASYSSIDGSFRIILMNSNGSYVRELVNQPSFSHAPAYHPNNRTLAFQSNAVGGDQIYRINDDGSGLQQLTNTGRNYLPAWSPDGTKIAFRSDRDGNNEIYVMNADGSNQTRLTNDLSSDIRPAWSPDGQKIVWTSDRTGTQQIWIMNADGSNPQQLTFAIGRSWGAAFTPDGTRIVFSSERDGNQQVYIMNADGSGQTRLSNNAEDEYDISTGTD